ncbi:hypothetical protein G6L37_02430 [Agrobacterium rubi]|nr:hypothetical protein [Agrobacterium rubi]NTF24252.1 hypothetical protein [Agrobacterium rubi]
MTHASAPHSVGKGRPDFGRRPSCDIVARPVSRRIATDYDWAWKEAAKAGNRDHVFNDWRSRRESISLAEWPPVYDSFRNSRQSVLYRLAVEDVVAAASRTGHSLGRISFSETLVDENRFAADISPCYPVIMILHDLMEALGRVPLWRDFEEHLVSRQDVCLRYFIEAGGIPPVTRVDGMWDHPRMRAVRWRLGLFYYSFLRDVHTIVTLRRTHGLDVRYHPLLDAEWKADAICGDVRIELYVVNSTYKDADKAGRKKLCSRLNPGLPVVEGKMAVKKDRGSCWLYSPESISLLAAEIASKGGPSVPSFNRPR